MKISFKTELKLNNKQRTLFVQHAGCSRFAWNWAVTLTKELLAFNKENPDQRQKFPSAIDLHKKFVAEVKSQHAWLYNSSKCSPQQALRDLRVAWDRCFNKISKSPKLKKKYKSDGFYLEGSIKIEPFRIKLPKIGWVRTYERLPIQEVKNVRITRKADKWFIAFKLEHKPEVSRKDIDKSIGVDLGVKSLAVCSDGTIFPNVRAFKKFKRKLASAQRVVSRRKKYSKNWIKAQKKVSKLHYKISCVRKDAIHKLTSWLTKNHGTVVIEDLNISGMLKNHRLANAIADSGFYECKRQLTYKSQLYGAKLVIADRWFPSSQLCSCCGQQYKIRLHERVYNCPTCKLELDRDLNASRNLVKLAVSSTVSSCGELNKLTATAVGALGSRNIVDNLRLFKVSVNL